MKVSEPQLTGGNELAITFTKLGGVEFGFIPKPNEVVVAGKFEFGTKRVDWAFF